MCWWGGAGWRSVLGQADLSLGLLEHAHSMAACDPHARSGQRSLEVTQQHPPAPGMRSRGHPGSLHHSFLWTSQVFTGRL